MSCPSGGEEIRESLDNYIRVYKDAAPGLGGLTSKSGDAILITGSAPSR